MGVRYNMYNGHKYIYYILYSSQLFFFFCLTPGQASWHKDGWEVANVYVQVHSKDGWRGGSLKFYI
jgi:hypothetical protein